MAALFHPVPRLAMAACAACALAACGGSDDNDYEPPAPPPPGEGAAPGARALDLTILHINDHHSNLAPRRTDLQIDTGTGARQTINVGWAGFARVTQAIEELAGQSPNVLKIHAGDAITGTLYFNRAGTDGQADAAMMNTVCFDSFTIGNHEFDKGDSGLRSFLDLLMAGPCQTGFLSANVQFGPDSPLHPGRAPDYVRPSMVVERDGEQIGLIGLTIAHKTQASSSPDPGTRFEDEVVAAQREIDRLSAQGVNKIILQSHIGYEFDLAVARQLRGVDVVIGGDSHTLLGPDALATYGVGTPAGPYPTHTTDAAGNPVCVAQAWEYSQVVGELKVSFDANGVVTGCAGTPHVLIGDDFVHTQNRAPLTGAERASLEADIAASGFLRVTREHAHAAEVLRPFSQQLEVFNTTEVALVQEELCSRRVPGGPGSSDYSRSSTSCNALGEVSLRGGDIQQIAAQAYLEVTQRSYGGADISLQSGGGARVALQPGRITAAEAISVLPFGNMLYLLEITGEQAAGMIEDGLEASFGANAATGPYPYTGGLRFDVNANQPRGSRASNLEVRNATSGQWEPINPSALYRLAVLSFNANGGDGYETLKNIPPERVLDVGVLDSDVFFQYLESQPTDTGTGLPTLRKLDSGLYSTRHFIGPGSP